MQQPTLQPPSHAPQRPRALQSGARHRWGIEANFLVEKHQGYYYKHAFALDWNAMKGYHSLMHMAPLFNTLARFARHLASLYRELGVRGTIAFLRQTCATPRLEPRAGPQRRGYASFKKGLH